MYTSIRTLGLSRVNGSNRVSNVSARTCHSTGHQQPPSASKPRIANHSLLRRKAKTYNCLQRLLYLLRRIVPLLFRRTAASTSLLFRSHCSKTGDGSDDERDEVSHYQFTLDSLTSATVAREKKIKTNYSDRAHAENRFLGGKASGSRRQLRMNERIPQKSTHQKHHESCRPPPTETEVLVFALFASPALCHAARTRRGDKPQRPLQPQRVQNASEGLDPFRLPLSRDWRSRPCVQYGERGMADHPRTINLEHKGMITPGLFTSRSV